MRNVFLEKTYIESGGETIPRHFSKKSKLSISLVYISLFIVCQVEDHQKILKLSCRPLACTSLHKDLLKNRKRSGTNFPTVFSV